MNSSKALAAPAQKASAVVFSTRLHHEDALRQVERQQLANLHRARLLRRDEDHSRADSRVTAIVDDSTLAEYRARLSAALDGQATVDTIREIVAATIDGFPRLKLEVDAFLQGAALTLSAERVTDEILTGAALDLFASRTEMPLVVHFVAACRARRQRIESAIAAVDRARIVRHNATLVGSHGRTDR